MHYRTDDVRIQELKELAAPVELLAEYPVDDDISKTVHDTRQAIHHILHGRDDRLLMVVGPCSIHDPEAALDYASRLAELSREYAEDLVLVMRVYFEKPRTTVGWKGLINDPYLDGTFRINDGLRMARKLLLDINALGLPAGTEFLDMITPQYVADLISWGAIGARTTESQVHRELASGLSCPVGFKNGTDGNIRIALDALRAARHAHHFLSVTKSGRSAIVSTKGNHDCHVILRGGNGSPNYDSRAVEKTAGELRHEGLLDKVMVDCSANSGKDYRRQPEVAACVAEQVAGGSPHVLGVMIESNINPGRQEHVPGKALSYGVSITDECIGWDQTVQVIEAMASAHRRHPAVTSA
jgi:3-deoxy-7-phosphoheptulonate synthase